MNSRKKIILYVCFFALVMAAVALFFLGALRKEQEKRAEQEKNFTVSVNEIKQLIKSGDSAGAESALDELAGKTPAEDVVKNDTGKKETEKRVLAIVIPVIICIMAVVIFMIFIYSRIVHPFEDMTEYAESVAKGNLEKTLKMDRENFFGDFTWAFDNMRREIIKSRTAEKNAIENNKTVIATLSHDIKTPIASIRAYAEAFEANMDSSAEKRQKYLDTLMQKCDEVTKLTNDLFLHSISEMNRLEVNTESIDIIEFLDKNVRKLFVEDSEVEIILPKVSGEEKKIMIEADPKRLLQIFENLKNNADKYAKTKVTIQVEDNARIHFRDYGPGIPDDEIPFITNKFYRGKNVGDETGSGLGLYIVNELMNKMGGTLKLYNKEPGLDAVLEFDIREEE
ncbi:MAG: HAMP domain-containing histidine kinase [Eubacterium sp.]|nr:HAMP domain-containing histidine kinase [Eubacterium sp.]